MSVAAPLRTVADAARATDFDLHGLVGIRLLDAAPRDIERVTAQLGPIRAQLTRPPDITVRYVDELALASPMRFVGLHDAGFTEDAFLVLRGPHKTNIRVQIPFDAIGGPCEIVCEHGAPAVPHLIGIINLTVLARGGVALHASAVRYRGRGVLITGWAKGGKTETLLGCLGAGAEYIGDEWVYVEPEHQRMVGIPEPVRVWDWQLRQFPERWDRLPRGDRLRLSSLRRLARAAGAAGGAARGDVGSWRRTLTRMAHLLERQCYTFLPPYEALGAGRGAPSQTLDTVVLVVSHDAPEVVVRRVAPAEVARRMAFSLQEERHELISAYRKFRFAHPARHNSLLEVADDLERGRLVAALRGRECLALYHPYPPSIPQLVTALEPYLERESP